VTFRPWCPAACSVDQAKVLPAKSYRDVLVQDALSPRLDVELTELDGLEGSIHTTQADLYGHGP
jgi:hypothetical protein